MYRQLKSLLRPYKNFLRKIIFHILRALPVSSEQIGPVKGFYESTVDWIALEKNRNSQKNLIEVYPSHWIYRLEPKTIYETIDWRFFGSYLGNEFKTPSTFIALIPKGRVVGETCAIITPDDKLLADVSMECGNRVDDYFIFSKLTLPKMAKLHETVAVLGSSTGAGNYFHWMFDVLPRIHVIKVSGLYKNIDRFVINKLFLGFQEETLNILGIAKEKIIETSGELHIKVDRLIVPSLPGIPGSMPTWACEFLRKEFLINEVLEKKDGPERIYISRANANSRKVLNEDEVINFLFKLGFKILRLEEMSFVNQVSIFASAKVVVAPHGAGLTNIVFCSPTTKVIELFSPKYLNPCYRALCNQVNLEYYYLLGKGEPLPNDYKGNFLTGSLGLEDILIDIDLLSETMKLANIDN